MFSGIIETLGEVVAVVDRDLSREIVVQSDFEGISPGASIACNGVCLTATESTQGGRLAFFISRETLQKTNLNHLERHSFLNLEKAVTPTTALSGHIVQGHVDTTALVHRLIPNPQGHEIIIAVPSFYQRYMVSKGSIVVNGISLTINHVQKSSDSREKCFVSLMIIPHTWENTTLKYMQESDLLNIEVDVVAKYIEAQMQPWQGAK